MKAGALEGGIIDRGGKTEFDREPSPAKELSVDGPNQSEEWGPTC